MYAKTTGGTEKLATVSFGPVGDRAGLEVRNRLVFLAGRGAGETTNPVYNVKLQVTSNVAGVLYLPTSSTSAAARETVTVAYSLTRLSDGAVLKAGSRYSIALLDLPTQEFGKIRAIADAEKRAAIEAADLVAADITATLTRDFTPSPQVQLIPKVATLGSAPAE